MGSDVRFVKSEKKVKKLKGRVTDLETSMSSWEERLMEIDQQHQNMFSQYNKKICKLSTELETVRAKLRSSQRKIKELEEKLEVQGHGAADSLNETVLSSTLDVDDQNQNKSTAQEPGPSRSETKFPDDNGNSQSHSEQHIEPDVPMSNDDMCRALNAAGTTLEPSPLPVTSTTTRTSTRLREKRHLKITSEEDSYLQLSETPFENFVNETVEIQSVSSSQSMSESNVVVEINPDYLYLETETMLEEEHGEHGEESKPFTCPKCPSIFEAEEDLETHVSSHELPYKCRLCPQRFGLDIGLDAHLEKAHFIQQGRERKNQVSQKTYRSRPRCPICQHTFGSNWALRKHTENIHGRGKDRAYYECELCNRKCLRKDSLNAHIMLVHRGEKPYSCLACKKGFSRKDGLNNHVCVPNMPTCSKCGKRFLTWKQVSGHMTTHRKNREKNCKTPSAKLIKMMRVNKQNTICVVCKFRSINAQSLRRHIKRQHPEILDQIDPPKASH